MASFSYKSNIFTAWYQNKSLTLTVQGDFSFVTQLFELRFKVLQY